VLALAPAASAQDPIVPLPAPAPEEANLTVALDSGISYKGRKYAIEGEKVVARGTLKPFVPGQKVLVRIFRGGQPIAGKTVNVRGGGVYSATLRVSRHGVLGLRATHDKTNEQKGATSNTVRFGSIVPSAHSGSSGTKVRLLQKGLARLGYVTHRGGRFDAATARAVLAFRKVNKLSRTTSAKRKIFRMLFAGKGGYKLRYPNAGKHVEFDWSRQVLVLARGAKAVRIYHASSGKPSTPTVFGSFRFYRRQAGTNHLGMVWTTYFYGGYAIHGYHSVPTYAASHGCIRVPIPNSHSIYRWLNLGDQIFVYR
jgi:lipoprotein-anchoring transpeptidase ErfK/SrfK